jgi:hypothetical protein
MSALGEVERVIQPGDLAAISRLLQEVASDHRPVIVKQGAADSVAIIPMEQFADFREWLAQLEAEHLAANLTLDDSSPPPPEWFDGEEPKPF